MAVINKSDVSGPVHEKGVCGIPNCVEYGSRICFGIALFDKEEHADSYAAEVKRKGRTYNGGWYHGMPCGRDKSWDGPNKEGGMLYAVTD